VEARVDQPGELSKSVCTRKEKTNGEENRRLRKAASARRKG
jgi:hypothetical protein